MRTFKITFLVSLLITGFSFAQETWEKIFEDEFNGSSLNSTVWTHETGTGSQYGLWGWGNGESQYYQSQNTTVSNGTAKIVAKQQNVGGMNYTSSRIKTDGKFTFKYGKVQARMKTVEGEGFWPAFWLLPSGGGWPCDGEIDIMEQWAHNGDVNVTTGAAHAGTCGEGSTYRSFNHSMAGSYADDFHIYEVRWYPDYIAWYVDDQKVFQITPADYPNDRWPFNDKNWYIILNLAITGSGPNNNTQFPSQIEIDWVRVYQPSDGDFNGHVDISGCLDPNASNYNANANDQAIDQWGNALCVYSSCADAPSEGCLYSDAFAGWHDNFNANDCVNYNGIPCEGSGGGNTGGNTGDNSNIEGCLDANADNYNAAATVQGLDQYGNIACNFSSCDDIPDAEGCYYTENYSAFHADFNAANCVEYGGTPCEGSGGGNTGGNTGIEGCLDANADNYNAAATVQGLDQYGNIACNFSSCDDIPDAEGCYYTENYSAFHADFNAANCVEYGGTPCEGSGGGNTGGNTGIEGCLDANADNYNAAATVQGLDQYGNIACNFSSCDDIPDAEGCFYTENYSAFHADFNAANCVEYGGTPCEGSGGGNTGGNSGSEGCIDASATNYDASASTQSLDQYGNLTCIYTSCNDIPEPGCIYSDGFGVFNPEFDGTACSGYGGTPCNESGSGNTGGNTGDNSNIEGCLDANADNYNAAATVQGLDQYGNIACNFSSCDDIPDAEGCFYTENYSAFHADFNAANCVEYGGTPCEGSGGGNTGGNSGSEGCIDASATNYDASASTQSLDQYGNLTCIYTSCNDIPEPGCIYSDGFGVFNPEFDGTACSGYGGTPCEGSFTEVPGCTDNTALNFNPNATQDNQTCEYSSCKPNWDFITTDQNHSIFINGTWIDVGGNPMKEGAVIGVFYEDDNGNLKSAGWAEFQDGTVQIAAMGDDSSSTETDGLTSNQEFIYRVWDTELCEEFSASITYSGGVETYTTNGITFISSITATETPSGPTEQELNLVKGWSIISTFMIPQDKDLGIILEPIIDKVIIAKDYAGAAYLPEYNFNGIGNVVVGQGYQIKTSEACDLTISGDYANPEQNPISCVQGWNMIGYLRTESAPCDMVLADMVDKVIIAKNSSGAAYLPEWSFNGIGHMKPGEGYQIKITDSGTLHYHSNDDAYRLSSLELTQNHTQHFPRVAPTDHNMTVIIEDEAWDIRPEIGSEIAAYDALGTIIGSAAYSRPLSVLSIWGDDATTSSKEGMNQKEIVSFKTWTSGKTTNFSVKHWKEGSETYQSNAINIATAIESHSELTNSATDDKSLVKIINLLGQEIKDPKDRFDGSVLFYLYDNGSVDKIVK